MPPSPFCGLLLASATRDAGLAYGKSETAAQEPESRVLPLRSPIRLRLQRRVMTVGVSLAGRSAAPPAGRRVTENAGLGSEMRVSKP